MSNAQINDKIIQKVVAVAEWVCILFMMLSIRFLLVVLHTFYDAFY